MDGILITVNTARRTKARQEVNEMLDMYATGTFAIDATDPRNQFNERALHEARVATEYRQYTVRRPEASGRLARLRAAVSGAQVVTTTQACGCPA
jgi:guanyl-specific ribonuclease Sa